MAVINPNKVGLAFGVVIGGWHLFWAALVVSRRRTGGDRFRLLDAFHQAGLHRRSFRSGGGGRFWWERPRSSAMSWARRSAWSGTGLPAPRRRGRCIGDECRRRRIAAFAPNAPSFIHHGFSRVGDNNGDRSTPCCFAPAAIRRRTYPKMNTPIRRRALAIGLAVALTVTAAVPSWAARVPANTAAVKSAVSGDVIDVRWRGHAATTAAGRSSAACRRTGARRHRRRGVATLLLRSRLRLLRLCRTVLCPAVGLRAAAGLLCSPKSTPLRTPRGGAYRQCWVQNDDRGFGYWRPC